MDRDVLQRNLMERNGGRAMEDLEGMADVLRRLHAEMGSVQVRL
jgi:hypothetical protein